MIDYDWTEADEVAESIWRAGQWLLLKSQDEARFIVKRFMPDESPQLIDNIAEALLIFAHRARSES